jgi:hypothetical protein
MSLRLNGSTSGYSEIEAPAVAGDQTFTLPGTGGTLLIKESSGDVDLGPLTIDGAASAGSVNLDSSGRLLVGTTSSTGLNSNTAPVIAGNFASFTGSVLTSSGVAGTLFSLENLNASYIVTALIKGAADAANYSAVSMVATVTANSRVIQTIRAGGLLSLSLSGADVRATQSSGTVQTITWSATRLANI